jgi:hypothetical protein
MLQWSLAIDRVVAQGNRWELIEHFKQAFSRAAGSPHFQSSSVDWASADLNRAMQRAAANAPLFIEAQAITRLQESLTRADELLAAGRGRQAVQETLWVLESLATAFRGVASASEAVGGRYFSEIARDLRRMHRGTNLAHALRWAQQLTVTFPTQPEEVCATALISEMDWRRQQCPPVLQSDQELRRLPSRRARTPELRWSSQSREGS